MKKIVALIILVLAVSFTASAQPRAIGVKLGSFSAVSYQHSVGTKDFAEINLGSFGFNSLYAGAAYNFMIVQPKWTRKGDWGFYAGPGVSLESAFNPNFNFGASVYAQVGLEYTFWFPLQLSMDLYPSIGFATGGNSALFYFNVLCFVPALSVRYRF